MQLQLYNTLTHKKEDFVPYTPGTVNMYTCGPTVYHYAHIGNLRSYICEDILEKYMAYTGLKVNRVMNITDVGHLSSDGDTGDDKMLSGAKREHKTVMEIADFYTKAFFEDCDALNIKKPEVVKPATDCIDDFIKVISTLIEKGFAYEAGGNIYFDTSKLDEYYKFGDFSGEDLAVAVRDDVDEDTNKRNKTDFVLWFTKSKFDDQELKWESPWGLGYPGWHIECSCISMKFLGEHLDIHCGGVDNAFPHHTNEIAQSEAYLGHKWCNCWFHVHHLNNKNGKMSKSKGEFLTVSLLKEKGYDPLAYRFFCLGSHYRKSLEFSYENLDNAVTAYNRLIARISKLIPQSDGKADEAEVEKLLTSFDEALANDINTSLAITALMDALKSDASPAVKLAAIERMDSVLSLDLIPHAQALLNTAESTDDIPAEVLELVEQRKAARKEKNFALADELRDRITSMGYVIEETREGTKLKKA